jgi:transposase-like protein
MKERRSYSREVRDAVLTAYFTGGESAGSLSERFSLGGAGVVYVWAQRYRDNYRHLLSDGGGNVGDEEKVKVKSVRPSSRKPMQEEDLAKRVDELEKALEYERMRSNTYEKLIEVAERDLGINIKKKSGVKR